MSKKIVVVNGANLNLLGQREPEKYGKATYADLERLLNALALELGIEIEIKQSNVEGELVNFIQAAKGSQGLVINAGGYTHTSVVIRDAISAINVPAIEVHITNIASRESFRHTSLISGVCKASIMGMGLEGYLYAVRHLCGL